MNPKVIEGELRILDMILAPVVFVLLFLTIPLVPIIVLVACVLSGFFKGLNE